VADAFNASFIARYRANGGRVEGELEDLDILLLTAPGAKSGIRRTMPVAYFQIDDRLVLVASMGGAERSPHWYRNVMASDTVTVEIGTESFEARAVDTDGADRDALYAEVCKINPVFVEYQERTSRVIPVVELHRVE
jgi:deazaflavin-dependent oxidoreductase (nitroreductase family)